MLILGQDNIVVINMNLNSTGKVYIINSDTIIDKIHDGKNNTIVHEFRKLQESCYCLVYSDSVDKDIVIGYFDDIENCKDIINDLYYHLLNKTESYKIKKED